MNKWKILKIRLLVTLLMSSVNLLFWSIVNPTNAITITLVIFIVFFTSDLLRFFLEKDEIKNTHNEDSNKDIKDKQNEE